MIYLYKGDERVGVADDPDEPSHAFWREKGFAPKGAAAAPKGPRTRRRRKAPVKEAAKEADTED